MDLGTIIGMILVIVCVAITIWLGKNFIVFWDPPALILVYGGAIAVILIGFPMEDVFSFFSITKNALIKPKHNTQEIIAYLVELSNKTRREGILSLQEPLKKSNDKFLIAGFQLVIDGQDPEATENILAMEIENIEARHKVGMEMWELIGALAPGMAMVGTLIGLVQMLASMNDPSTIGPAMSLALVCTFYGAFTANGFAIPMAKKLKNRSTEELAVKGLIKEAILAIQAGDNPRIVEQKLQSYLPPKFRISSFEKK